VQRTAACGLTRICAFLALCLFAAPSEVSAQSNPFGVGSSPDQKEEQTSEPRRSASPFGAPPQSAEPAEEPVSVMPSAVRAVFRQIADWQREINRYLAGQLRETSDQGGLTAALTVIAASFIYGVLHAAGPGHGKLVVASYFTARDAPLRTGILMGAVIATTQAVVAIAMVAVLAMVLGGSQMQILERADLLEVVSYGFILAIGLYMTYGAVTGRATCGHDHDGHDHDGHGHQDHPHAHDHHEHGHAHGPDPNAKDTWLARNAARVFGPRGEVVAIGMVSGVRPCTGSILVLLFAVANGVFLLGVIASFMMAAGVAITISALGIGAIVLRKSVAGHEEEPSPLRAFMGRALSIGGSLAVAVIGGLLFGGALERTGLLA
jgi:nickel/cobalt exporter